MFENVLVGVDGRPNARDAVALAQRLVDRDGQLTLAHVHRGEMPSIELLQPELAAANVNMELKSVVAAHAGAGLHRQADTQHADLLVVGACSHGLLGRAMLADNTAAALNGAPCAVAVAAHGYAEQRHAIKTVGVAYNASPESKAALEHVKAFLFAVARRRLADHLRARAKAPELDLALSSIADLGPGPVTEVVERNGYRVDMRVTPNKVAVPDDYTVRLTRNGAPVRGATVIATFTMLDMDMPTQAYRLAERSPGVYEHSSEALVMVGRWGLTFEVQPAGAQAFDVVILDHAAG